VLRRFFRRVEILFGFPIPRADVRAAIISRVERASVRLGLIPKTMRGKTWLKRLFLGPLVPMPAELAPGAAAHRLMERVRRAGITRLISHPGGHLVALCLSNRVLMAFPQEANDAGGAVDDDREQARDVATEHAHVKRFQVGDCREPTAKQNLSAVLVRQANTRLDGYGRDQTAEATDAIGGRLEGKPEQPQHGRVEHGAIRTRVQQERSGHPRLVGRKHFARDNGTGDAVIPNEPFTVDAHRCA